MKLKYTFEIMEIDDQLMAVPVGDGADEFRGILKLNASAVAIFGLLKEEISEEEIVEALKNEYEDSKELKTYVHDYLEQLKEAGFIE